MKTIVDEILGNYPDRYRPLSLESLDTPGGFSGAVIARLRTAHGDFCLRGWPPDGLPPRRLRGLHRLLGTIFAQGVSQVAVPVVAKAGSTLVSAGNRLWQLEPWMPGRADFRENPSEARLRAVMACLACWHQVASTFRSTDDERPWFVNISDAPSPAVVERLQILRGWNSDRLKRLERRINQSLQTSFREIAERVLLVFKLLSPHVDAELQSSCSQRFALQPCLRDVWHDHILFSEDEVTGLIDPSSCRSENVTTDLARLLGSLVSDDRRLWNIALDEYRKHRSLSPEEFCLLRVLDHSGVLLSAMTWLDRHYLQRIAYSENQLQRIAERLQLMHSRLEHLVASI